MGFLRAIFLFAIAMLIIGVVGTHYLLANLFGSPTSAAPGSVAVAVRKSTSPTKHHRAALATATPGKAVARPTSSPAKTATATPTPTSRPPTATPTVQAVTRYTLHRIKAGRRHGLSRPKPTVAPAPTPTATSGTVTLTSYWVGDSTAQPGQTVSIGYVIDNGTGHTVRITLGASIKSSHVISWLSGQINDPYHDVVAVVPPGVSTHIRYFTLPERLHAGTYDVAWGLRNALSGGREALVAAPDALRVRG